jgi:hypothetical protein
MRSASVFVASAVLTLAACAAPPLAPAVLPDPPLDPLVVEGVAAVSPQRIDETIRSLAGFGTRSTLSETASDTHGIGAARRWIQRRLETCSRAAGGRLQVGTDAYVEPAGKRLPRATEIVDVIATLPGTDPVDSRHVIVVSGHYDSRASDVMDGASAAPGADDDGSGVAAMIEMACVMSHYRFGKTLVFMAVAGEEQGLLGSEHWAAEATRRGLQIEAMITNDIIGSPVGDRGEIHRHRVRLFADAVWPLMRAMASSAAQGEDAVPGPEVRKRIVAQSRFGGIDDFPVNQFGRHLKQMGERYVTGFTVQLIQRSDRYLRGGDHMPFLERGLAAVRFTEPVENFKHQHQNVRTENGVAYGDLPEFVDSAYLADVTRVNLAGLATLALAPVAPRHVQIEVIGLGNDTTLRWDPNPEPGLAGYRVVWRDTGAPTWEHMLDVGKVTRTTVEVSKDNVIFGVQALDHEGHASLASFPMPVTH